MAEIPIQPEHRDILARVEHIGEFLQGEQQRLAIEAAHVAQQLARLNAEAHSLLQRAYGLDAQHVPVKIISACGVLVTPDAPDAPVEPS